MGASVVIADCGLLVDAQPTPEEADVFAQVKAVLDHTANVLAELESYHGAGEQIRVVSGGRLGFF